MVLVGVSRSGKTPTCLYMALQYGVFAANYPLTDEELEASALPPRLEPHRKKLYGLTIAPERLRQIREERRPQSRYASLQQVSTRSARPRRFSSVTALRCSIRRKASIEEIASRILNEAGIERRLRP